MSKKRVLFLCTGNSCRSQMAEGLVNHFLGETWEAHSAGTRPTGAVHPLAVKAMADLGIDISGQRSKSLDEFRNAEFDLVVTVCNGVTDDCPLWIGKGYIAHVSFPDPAQLTGTRYEQQVAFQIVRDLIHRRVFDYLRR
jgi:arsenate reductase